MVEDSPILNGKVTVCSSAVFNPMRRIDPKTRRTLIEKEGFDPEYVDSHKPNFMGFDKSRYEEADIIIGMTKSHKIMLNKKYKDKFLTLSEVATGKYEAVADPWLEKDIEKYFTQMQKLKDFLEVYKLRLEDELKEV